MSHNRDAAGGRRVWCGRGGGCPPDARPARRLRLSRAAQVGYISATAHPVQWHSPRIIAEELQSPGISRVYRELMTTGGQNTYSLRLPDSTATVSFGNFQAALGTAFQATALAVDTGSDLPVSPAWDTPLTPGSVLYYICRQRIAPDQLPRALRHEHRRADAPDKGRSAATQQAEQAGG